MQQSYFGYQQYFIQRLSADLTAVNTHMTTEGYYEDETKAFDECDSGTPNKEPPKNSGYYERKKQFAIETPVKNNSGEITGWKWVRPYYKFFFAKFTSIPFFRFGRMRVFFSAVL